MPLPKSRILSLDPGVSTGVAVLEEYDGVVSFETTTVTEASSVWGLILSSEWLAVVCENYASGGVVSKYGLQTVRLIGGIQALCFTRGIYFKMQPNQMRLAYVDEAEKIVEKAGKKKTAAVHEISALAHLLAWRATQT